MTSIINPWSQPRCPRSREAGPVGAERTGRGRGASGARRRGASVASDGTERNWGSSKAHEISQKITDHHESLLLRNWKI